MDEYIKREDALKAITYNGLSDPPEIIHLTLLTAQKNIRHIPTADVVPTSEVETMQRMYGEKLDVAEALIATLNKTKTEVAREIFEEIEKQSIYHFAMRTYSISELKLAKLKKKYTEVEHEP